MKKSQLRQLIREVIKSSINENVPDNEGIYRVYMNSDPDEPKRIDYERYFGDGTKAEMIKQAKKWAYGKDPYNQYGDPILVVVTHEDDINDVAWTNSKLYDVNHDFFDPDGNEYIDYDREEYDYSESVNEGKGIELADRYVAKLRQEFKNLSDDEVNEFRKAIAEAFDLRWGITRDGGRPPAGVYEGQDNFGMGVDFNPPSERNPSNKMIYDLVKALYELLNKK